MRSWPSDPNIVCILKKYSGPRSYFKLHFLKSCNGLSSNIQLNKPQQSAMPHLNIQLGRKVEQQQTGPVHQTVHEGIQRTNQKSVHKQSTVLIYNYTMSLVCNLLSKQFKWMGKERFFQHTNWSSEASNPQTSPCLCVQLRVK